MATDFNIPALSQSPWVPQTKKEQPVPPRNFDSTFEKYRGSIPLEYLRALAIVTGNGEFKPNASTSDSAGLFMVSVGMLDVYGKAVGKTFKPTDLADIQLNTQVAVWLLNNVKKYYSLNYPKSLAENWKNTNYVAIITLGYKVGHSEKGGVGDALKVIEAKYPEKMSIDTVAQVAKELKLADYIYSPRWIEFAKHVANLYAGSPRETSVIDTVRQPIQSVQSGSIGPVAGMLVLGGVVAMALVAGKKR